MACSHIMCTSCLCNLPVLTARLGSHCRIMLLLLDLHTRLRLPPIWYIHGLLPRLAYRTPVPPCTRTRTHTHTQLPLSKSIPCQPSYTSIWHRRLYCRAEKDTTSACRGSIIIHDAVRPVSTVSPHLLFRLAIACISLSFFSYDAGVQFVVPALHPCSYSTPMQQSHESCGSCGSGVGVAVVV
jgi:hypothetical protein